MPKKKTIYKPGDIFLVPLRSNGLALGLISRIDHDGGLIAYFFNERYLSPPLLTEVSMRTSADSMFICALGDRGFKLGTWIVLGVLPEFKPEHWPMPPFARKDALTGEFFRIVYDEKDFFTELERTPITKDEAVLLPPDGTFGHGAVEIRLTKLLEQQPAT